MSSRPAEPSRSTPPLAPLPEDARAVEALTSVWMLALVNTLLCEIGALSAIWYAARNDGAKTAALFGGLLLLVAIVLGVMTLVLTGLVLRLRREPPPRSVTAAALLIGAAPLVIWAILSLL